MNFISTLESASFPSSEHWPNARNRSRSRRRSGDEEGGYRQPEGKPYESLWHTGHSYNILCKWEPFRDQIIRRWDRLTTTELDAVGPNRSKLAVLIESKYGMAAHLVENYLRNFERTLPLI